MGGGLHTNWAEEVVSFLVTWAGSPFPRPGQVAWPLLQNRPCLSHPGRRTVRTPLLIPESKGCHRTAAQTDRQTRAVPLGLTECGGGPACSSSGGLCSRMGLREGLRPSAAWRASAHRKLEQQGPGLPQIQSLGPTQRVSRFSGSRRGNLCLTNCTGDFDT